jgi:NADH-quinone oxidoreductase subunit N
MTFTYSVQPDDWLGVAPILVLVVLALILMLVDAVLPHAGERSRHSGPANFVVLPIISLVGIVGAMVAAIILSFTLHRTLDFNNMISSSTGTLYAYLIILVAGGLGVLLSPAYLKRLNLVHQGEYYALLMFAITGMMLLSAATNFLIIFVGLEMFSLALYILCSFVEQRRTSQEAGMKYFLLSSFASAFLLYGIALVYAGTGSTSLVTIGSELSTLFMHGHASASTLLLVGLALLTVGFAFKVSAVPFQTWTPDVYQGAPAPITAFMSVGTKVAALLAFVRVFGFAFLPIHQEWMPVVWALAVLTIVGGNIMALGQPNLKRMLAYSSVAHAGYLLIGIVIGGSLGATAILFYLSCYLFMNLGAFGVISALEKSDNSGYETRDLRGLWYRRPWLAGFLAFFLLALAGFPPMAGFAAKYYIFYVALQGGHPELLIIGVIMSVLGIYYYLRPIATMFMQREEGAETLAEVGAPVVPPTPTRAARGTHPTTGSLSTRSTTALAERPAPAKVAASPLPISVQESSNGDAGRLVFMTWLGIGIAALGTLLTGVILPFWLPALQQAASGLLR